VIFRREYWVYTITCQVNSKVYVGFTRRGNYRLREHFAALHKNRHTHDELGDDFIKYGEQAFAIIVVLKSFNREDALDEEKRLMSSMIEKGICYNYGLSGRKKRLTKGNAGPDSFVRLKAE
jgi:group I intron endonuclease